MDWRLWDKGDEARVKHLAASLAARSDHPVSQAIAASLTGSPIGKTSEIQNFTALPGRGVQGQIKGQTLQLGNHRLMHENGFCSPELEAELAIHEQQGRSVTLLADTARVLAVFADMGASLLVVGNGLRLLRRSKTADGAGNPGKV